MGASYLRELPPLRAVLNDLGGPDTLMVNGYADLDPAVGPARARMRTPSSGSRRSGSPNPRSRTATHALPVVRGSAVQPFS
jgi:deoxyribonuclease V